MRREVPIVMEYTNSWMVYLVVSIAMGVPKTDGLFIEKIPLKWMMTRGTPIAGNPHLVENGGKSFSNGCVLSIVHIVASHAAAETC